MKRKWLLTALALIAVTAAAPFFPADLFRPPIQRALERELGRKVEIGGVHFTLFPSWTPAPGFTLDEVTIHEDPRAGIEPFAYVDSLGASVRLLSLFRRKLEFSSLNLGGQTVNINMVKTQAGPWNFQFLLGGPAGSVRAMPALRMRGGRVNFKFGDTKSVFYFDDADLDIAPSSDGSLDLRFGGAPARTDQSAQNFGRFFIRGAATPGNRKLDFKVELERSSLEETMRLFDPSGFGVHGTVALDARLSGTPTELKVAGQIQVGDVHRWDLLPTPGSAWQMPFAGTLDLRTERLDLLTTSDNPRPPVAVRFHVRDFLSAPDWDAGADLNEVPLEPLLEIARHMGASLPEKLAVEGSVSGSLAYDHPNGVSGRVELSEASVSWPDSAPLRAASASLEVAEGVVHLKPATVRVGDTRSVEMEGNFALMGGALTGARAMDLKMTTRAGLSIVDMRSFGLGQIPLLEHATQGSWRGWARFRAGDRPAEKMGEHGAEHATERPAERPSERLGEWSSESELLDARIPIDGLADPVRIQSALVSLNGKRVSLTKLKARAGAVNFTGDYRWDPAAARPHRFTLVIVEADAAELQRLLQPSLVRERGFLARTLGLGPAPALPDWLSARHAEGTVSIDSLTAGEALTNSVTKLRGLSARVRWDAGKVRLTGLAARADTASIAGDLEVDVSGAAPQFHFDGAIKDLVYRGGRLDLDGTLDAGGSGLQLLESAHAEGHLRGRSIAFAPEAEFRTFVADFQAGPGPFRWKLSNVEAAVGAETYLGTGVSQSDGRMVLDLVSRGRRVSYAGALLATGTAP